VDWIEPNDFSLSYKDPTKSIEEQDSQSNSESSNQSISTSEPSEDLEDSENQEPTNDESIDQENSENENSENENSENENSENQEQENDEYSSEPSSEQEPSFEELLNIGSWSILNPVIVNESCNVDSWSAIVDIYELIPSEFEIINASNTDFTMNLMGASILCTIENEDFYCDSYESNIPVPNFDASGDVLFLYEGTLLSSSFFIMNLEIDIYNCTGNDCAILAFLVPYPCQITMESDAEFLQ
jgi:hypothetical protein